jgi:hypothetical protein
VEELTKKISEYQVFNFLFPGTVFAAAITRTTSIDLVTNNLLVAVFVYYFIGLIISRVGSIIVGPTLKQLRIVRFAPYRDYLKAAKSDSMIPILSQENNTYRTLIAALLIYLIVYWLDVVNVGVKKHFSQHVITITLSLIIVALLILSYRKQTGLITKRIGKG